MLGDNIMSNKDILENLKELEQYSHGDDSAAEVRTITVEVPSITAGDLKLFRKRLNITQQALATFLGVSVKTVQNWESGRNHPNASARRLIQLLDKNPKLIDSIFILK